MFAGDERIIERVIVLELDDLIINMISAFRIDDNRLDEPDNSVVASWLTVLVTI